MASFETDLARHLAAYDAAEATADAEREMTEHVDDWHLNGENAVLIPEPGTFGAAPAIWDDREIGPWEG